MLPMINARLTQANKEVFEPDYVVRIPNVLVRPPVNGCPITEGYLFHSRVNGYQLTLLEQDATRYPNRAQAKAAADAAGYTTFFIEEAEDDAD